MDKSGQMLVGLVLLSLSATCGEGRADDVVESRSSALTLAFEAETLARTASSPPGSQVTSESGASVKLIGSDRRAWPCAIVTDALPEKARARSVVVSMVLLTGFALQTATWAALIVTGPLPNSFENFTRSWLPPTET